MRPDGMVPLPLCDYTRGTTMPKFVDRTGLKYGRLTAISRAPNKGRDTAWLCQCECGNVATVASCALVTGNTTSCGCVLKATITKHGGWEKSSYNTWRAMMRRCYKPHDKDYPRYGGVGVKVCQQWHEYVNFVSDMGEPIGDETLDRMDPYGDYDPSNCRWAGLTAQARNKRLHSKNKSGYTGVRPFGNKWFAALTKDKKSYYSTCFSDIQDAIAARKALEQTHWGAGSLNA